MNYLNKFLTEVKLRMMNNIVIKNTHILIEDVRYKVKFDKRGRVISVEDICPLTIEEINNEII